MPQIRVVVLGLTEIPGGHVGAELLGKGSDSGFERSDEDVVSRAHRVAAEGARWDHDGLDDFLQRQVQAHAFRHDRIADHPPKLRFPRDVDTGFDRALVDHEVPVEEEEARILDHAGGREIVEHGNELASRNGEFIGLEAHHVGHREAGPAAQHLDDPQPPVGVGPTESNRIHVRVVARDQVVVRGREKAFARVHDVRLRGNRQIAIPLVTTVAGHGYEAAPVAANRSDADRLPANRPIPIGPDHVLAGDVGVIARLAELLPRRRLIHTQRSEVRRAPDLHPRGPHGVREVPVRVLEYDRAVARVFELRRVWRLPLHGDLLGDHCHRNPLAPIPVLVRVRRVRVVDVEILSVGREDRQSPRPVLVVPDGDARQARLSAADHVPPGADQMHPVAQGRCTLSAMGVVRHNRISAL